MPEYEIHSTVYEIVPGGVPKFVWSGTSRCSTTPRRKPPGMPVSPGDLVGTALLDMRFEIGEVIDELESPR